LHRLTAPLVGMARRGLLMRVKERLYYIVPFEQSSEHYMPNWHDDPIY
jgi:hypothetical protein